MFRLPVPLRPTRIDPDCPPIVVSKTAPLPVTASVPVDAAASARETSSVTLTVRPVKLNGLPARVTVPALLLTIRALRSNGVPDAPMSLVAVYDDDCVAAVPKVSEVVDPGAGGVPPCQFAPADQLPPTGLFQMDWA